MCGDDNLLTNIDEDIRNFKIRAELKGIYIFMISKLDTKEKLEKAKYLVETEGVYLFIFKEFKELSYIFGI